MSKRRLSKQQTTRIQERRHAKETSATEAADDQLGQEQEGLVICHLRQQAVVEPIHGGPTSRCHLRANLGNIVAGDRVIWRAGPAYGVVTAVFPRSTELQRPDSYGKLKLIAANVNQMLITIAPEPAAHHNLIDRYLILAKTLNVKAALLLNKQELLEKNSHTQQLLNDYSRLGYHTFSVSAKNSATLESLQQYLKQGTSIFVGQSGVGKSSIIQTLLPDEEIKIGELSEQVKKGKHTTTHAKLYHFPFGGHCIDSPGIRELGLWHLTADQVVLGFPEFSEHINQCRFRNCSHQHEPGCALLAALDRQQIDKKRFESYRQIIDSLNDVDVH